MIQSDYSLITVAHTTCMPEAKPLWCPTRKGNSVCALWTPKRFFFWIPRTGRAPRDSSTVPAGREEYGDADMRSPASTHKAASACEAKTGVLSWNPPTRANFSPLTSKEQKIPCGVKRPGYCPSSQWARFA